VSSSQYTSICAAAPSSWGLNPACADLNLVRAGLVERAEDWPRSSARDYSGSLNEAASANRVLSIDRILLPRMRERAFEGRAAESLKNETLRVA
jgi:hypothetical protein